MCFIPFKTRDKKSLWNSCFCGSILFYFFVNFFTRELTHKKTLRYESVFKLVNKAFWFEMAFLQDREMYEY